MRRQLRHITYGDDAMYESSRGTLQALNHTVHLVPRIDLPDYGHPPGVECKAENLYRPNLATMALEFGTTVRLTTIWQSVYERQSA